MRMTGMSKTVNVRVYTSPRCSLEALEVGRDGLDHSRASVPGLGSNGFQSNRSDSKGDFHRNSVEALIYRHNEGVH